VGDEEDGEHACVILGGDGLVEEAPELMSHI